MGFGSSCTVSIWCWRIGVLSSCWQICANIRSANCTRWLQSLIDNVDVGYWQWKDFELMAIYKDWKRERGLYKNHIMINWQDKLLLTVVDIISFCPRIKLRHRLPPITGHWLLTVDWLLIGKWPYFTDYFNRPFQNRKRQYLRGQILRAPQWGVRG